MTLVNGPVTMESQNRLSGSLSAVPSGPLLIVAGDPSGDLHGSRLMRALKEEADRAGQAGLGLAAVGGPLMQREADEFLYDLASLGVSGFLEPLKRLGTFWSLGRRIGDFMTTRRPRAVVCIDFYGFNRWVLAMAKRADIKTFYFISPQVWATRPRRVQKLKRLADKMIVIFPFEEKLYRDAGVPVSFVGHPLLDLLPEADLARGPDGILKVGLLPGSRPGEVKRHLPLFLEALDIMRRRFPRIEASLWAPPHLADDCYAPCLERKIPIVREAGYLRRSKLDLALSSSGTATLENALLGVPMVAVYKTGWPTYAVARALMRVPFIAMPNLLAGKRLVPELIQGGAVPERIAEEALGLLDNPVRLRALRETLASLRRNLGGPGASRRAARIILGLEP